MAAASFWRSSFNWSKEPVIRVETTINGISGVISRAKALWVNGHNEGVAVVYFFNGSMDSPGRWVATDPLPGDAFHVDSALWTLYAEAFLDGVDEEDG